MTDIEEKLRALREKYPLVKHTNAGRLYSTVRRMKAEKEQAIPISRGTGFALSVEDGKAANEMDESRWEEFYHALCDELKKHYPDLYDGLFE